MIWEKINIHIGWLYVIGVLAMLVGAVAVLTFSILVDATDNASTEQILNEIRVIKQIVSGGDTTVVATAEAVVEKKTIAAGTLLLIIAVLLFVGGAAIVANRLLRSKLLISSK